MTPAKRRCTAAIEATADLGIPGTNTHKARQHHSARTRNSTRSNELYPGRAARKPHTTVSWCQGEAPRRVSRLTQHVLLY
eukprot:5025040-Alexandrium_andersonii.AAC.1